MKKLIKIIIILVSLVVLFALVMGLVIVINIKNETNDTDEKIIANNVSLNDAISKQLALSLDESTDTGVATISLSEYDMNEILYGAVQLIPSSLKFKVLSAYVKLDEDNYYLYVPIKVYGTKSLLYGKISLDITQEYFAIELKEVKIGKLSVESGLIKFISRFFSNQLKKFGVKMTQEADSVRLSITRQEIYNQIKDKFSDSEYSGLIATLYKVFFIDNECLVFNVNNPLNIEMKVDFSVFNGQTNVHSLDVVKSDIKNLLDNTKFQIKDVGVAASYFASGYSHLSDEMKQKVDAAFASIYDPVTLHANTGYINRSPATIKEIVAAQVAHYQTGGLNITDAILNNLLSQLSLLGVGIGFATYDTHLVSYILIDEINTFIQDDYLKLSIRLNINGYCVNISCDFDVPQSSNVSIDCTVKTIMIGSSKVSDDNIEDLFNFLMDQLSDEKWIEKSDKPNTMVLNFKSFYEESTILSAIFAVADSFTTSLYENTNPSTGGYINIRSY